ncbi:cyclodeaminase/cyclohydrolase family protein [Anaerosphaera multitolerans]|uniref:Formimidoyltetrahydrofolate cyclodeaminase n=1 Tax=Anaerosphaera multitolerans TaxID=2487351 RepID=A0A437S939_9FIRM|nr:cyclodeaminase/cyclohydrolase family protein [Anaerosphaera multitolerans]RVU55619.1 formimidoyltetrahydrofolate cyclodeaminase [Anaerosphaera multitolerans]
MDYKEIFDLILDENNFTVGGGSSSAIAGAMGCGLMGMVVNLSKSKDYGYSDKEYDDMLEELNDLKTKLLKGSVEDNKAYLLIRDAYKLPKSTEEEKEARKKAIQNAGIEAAKVPLSNAMLNKRVNEIGMSLLDKSNPACITDLQAGIDFSKVGIDAGRANVEANLPLIKDQNIVDDFNSKIENL